jgi:hypothetical protein
LNQLYSEFFYFFIFLCLQSPTSPPRRSKRGRKETSDATFFSDTPPASPVLQPSLVVALPQPHNDAIVAPAPPQQPLAEQQQQLPFQQLSLPVHTAESFFMVQLHRYAQVHVAPKLTRQLLAKKQLQDAPHDEFREASVSPVMSEWFNAFCRANRLPFGFAGSKKISCSASREFLSSILAPAWQDDAIVVDHTESKDCITDPDHSLPCLHRKRVQIADVTVVLQVPQEILLVTLQVRQLDMFGEEMYKR